MRKDMKALKSFFLHILNDINVHKINNLVITVSDFLSSTVLLLLSVLPSYNKAYKLRRYAPWPAAHFAFISLRQNVLYA